MRLSTNDYISVLTWIQELVNEIVTADSTVEPGVFFVYLAYRFVLCVLIHVCFFYLFVCPHSFVSLSI